MYVFVWARMCLKSSGFISGLLSVCLFFRFFSNINYILRSSVARHDFLLLQQKLSCSNSINNIRWVFNSFSFRQLSYLSNERLVDLKNNLEFHQTLSRVRRSIEVLFTEMESHKTTPPFFFTTQNLFHKVYFKNLAKVGLFLAKKLKVVGKNERNTDFFE